MPSRDLQKSSTGPVYEKGQHSKAALRGFTFPGNNAIGLFIQKTPPLALAKANGKATLAVDPSSEGMQPDSGLSAADMKIVTLWLLKPTHVGPGSTGPGIEAARYASSVWWQEANMPKIVPLCCPLAKDGQ